MKNNSSKNNIALYFGSFNPIHIGHLIIASYILDSSKLDRVWFVVSPQNPLKDKKTLLNNNQRLAMVKIAIDDNPKFKACDIEFNLPTPSYTVNTLAALKEKFPDNSFHLILGEDNLQSFKKWRNYEKILNEHTLYVYPRKGNDAGELKNHNSVKLVDAPIIEISSSFIRKAIKEKGNFRYYLPEKVYQYICEMHFYEK